MCALHKILQCYFFFQYNKPILQPTEWFDITKQLVEIIHKLQKEGFYHCDIKTDNVMVRFQDKNITPVLIDFGISVFGINNINDRTGRHQSDEIVSRQKKLLSKDDLLSTMRMGKEFPMAILYEYCTQYCKTPRNDRAMHSSVLSDLKTLL